MRSRSHHCGRHSTTNRRTANMAGNLYLRLFVLLAAVFAEPAPGRVPKVYNALITSNQNLEPSKAYPVYQPVLHDSFAFSVQPALFYGGEYPIGNGIVPVSALPKESEPPKPSLPEPSRPENPTTEAPTPNVPATPEPAPSDPQPKGDSATAAPPPPNTESPIPLNEFGLPPQILPLGRINPAYNGFTQLGPYAYSYPSVRYYDPFDPFSLGPYGFPIYRPLPNVLGPSLIPYAPGKPLAAPAPVPEAPADQSAQNPPPEPNDLNVLNYSSKDSAIPNVPPPPLPQGGLKSDKSE